MASHEAQRNFQKLKLDTSGWTLPPRKDHVEATGIPVPASQILGRTGHLDVRPQSTIPEEVEGGDAYQKDTQIDSVIQSSHERDGMATTVGGSEEKSPVQPRAIRARTSKRQGGRSMMQELAQSAASSKEPLPTESAVADEAGPEIPPDADDCSGTSEYRRGEPRWPLLQETADELADEDRYDKDGRTSPSSAASPVLDGSRTPGYFFFGEHSLSPSIATSPVQQFPSLHDSGFLSSPKVRDGLHRRFHDRPSTVRRESRRSSAKSSLAKSPAGSFLSQFAKGPDRVPEPDEDGQSIGDHGEYIIGRQIGYGGFSTIKEIYSLERQTQMMRAVKIVRKQVSDKNEEDNERLQTDFGNEVSIWRLLRHENLLPLVAVFSNPFATFCIMEMNTGGTLFDLVKRNRRRGSSTLSPRVINQEHVVGERKPAAESQGLHVKLTGHYLRQLSSALRYLHQDMHIVHRDIKLENCLISTQSTDLDQDPHMKLLLCDFGMADFIIADEREEPMFEVGENGGIDLADGNTSPHIIGPSELSTNIAGSLEYASPELIRSNAPLRAPCIDIWAFGVLAHALFTADLPFRHSLPPKIQMMILTGLWDKRPLGEACGEQSPGWELVTQCLEMEAQKRWTIQEIVDCKLFA